MLCCSSEENAATLQPESERDVDRERESKRADGTATATERQFEDAAEPRGGLGLSTRGIGFSSSSGSSSSAAPSGLSRATIVEPNAQPRASSLSSGHLDNRDRRSSERLHSHAPVLDEFGREIRYEPKRKCEDQRSDKHDDRRTSSSSNDNHRNNERYRSSESHTSGEKRRRTSAWDSRSPCKTPLTSRVVLLQVREGRDHRPRSCTLTSLAISFFC